MLEDDHRDPNVEHGKAKADGIAYYIHIGCPDGNDSGTEMAMSHEYYDDKPIHLEAGRIFKGQTVPLVQPCTVCATNDGLIFLGTDTI